MKRLAKKMNSAIFPGLQGGPLMHVSCGESGVLCRSDAP